MFLLVFLKNPSGRLNFPLSFSKIIQEPWASTSGNSEKMIRLVKSSEDPRYGLGTTKSLQDRLKQYLKMQRLDQIWSKEFLLKLAFGKLANTQGRCPF